MIRIFLLVFLVVFSMSSVAQMVKIKSPAVLLKEVYPSDMITQQHIDRATAQYSRIQVYKSTVAVPGAIALSTIDLKDKHKNLTREAKGAQFNPAAFNPFKYFLNFYPKTVIHYHIDGTDYYVRILPLDK